MKQFRGIPASPGIAIGPIFFIQPAGLELNKATVDDVQAEIFRLETAIDVARNQILEIHDKAATELSPEEAAIFEAHALFLDDPSLIDSVNKEIRSSQINAEVAWQAGIEATASELDAMEDAYFRARAADVRDVGQRVLRILLGVDDVDLSKLQDPSIIVARDLTPSDTVRLDKKLVLGFCTAEGGPTSHTAILAKALCIPAVVGVKTAILSLQQGELLMIDGEQGEVIASPNPSILNTFTKRREVAEQLAHADLGKALMPAKTMDGSLIEVVANVGSLEDAALALERGAEGIGLLRTEFLYLDRSTSPDEQEQLKAYNAIIELMGTRPVVVRTLDVGGDKDLPYLDLGQENNPFLGWRAIRMCLDQPNFFKIQLRALLRASPGHDLRIMFPMIATLSEVRQAKLLLQEAKVELETEGLAVADNIQVGIMVEIPSVAILADRFAREVDFFSIGTNDLTQYTMAAERTNEKVAHLSDACHPAVLRQIQRVIQAAHQEGIWVGLCGELAGDADAIPILLGLGLDEFSMAPAAIPRAKEIIRRWHVSEAQKLIATVLDLDSAEAVRAFIRTA